MNTLLTRFFEKRCAAFTVAIWFTFFNSLIFYALYITHYIRLIEQKTLLLMHWSAVFLRVFITMLYLSHFALLASGLLLFFAFFILLSPRPWVFLPLSVLTATLASALLFADNQVFHLFHFHINTILLQLILNKDNYQAMGLSFTEIRQLLLGLGGLLTLEALLACGLYRRRHTLHQSLSALRYWLYCLTVFFLFSLLIALYSAASNNYIYYRQTETFPFMRSI